MNIKNYAELAAGDSFTQNSGYDVLTELVPVVMNKINGRELQTVSAKQLHAYLGVGRDLTNWIKGRINEYGFVVNEDYVVFDSPNLVNQSTKNNHSLNYKTQRGGDRRSKDYLLSIGMAKELAMVERNEQGRAVRHYFIQCERDLYQSVPEVIARYRQQLKARLGVTNQFKAMCNSLQSSRAELGKETNQTHYSNESNMINRIVLGGLTAKQWANLSGFIGAPRDNMNTEQLEHLAYLESTNITLLDMGMDYAQRKDELMRLSQRWLAKRMEVIV